MNYLQSWQTYAIGSAVFASLTALFGKLGVAGMNSNLATLIRTVVILLVSALVITIRNEWQPPKQIPLLGATFLVLSGIATGLSWLCYYRALQLGPVTRVAPIDKLSVALTVVLGALVLGEQLTWQIGLGAGLIVAGSLVILMG